MRRSPSRPLTEKNGQGRPAEKVVEFRSRQKALFAKEVEAFCEKGPGTWAAAAEDLEALAESYYARGHIEEAVKAAWSAWWLREAARAISTTSGSRGTSTEATQTTEGTETSRT